jgi:regulator of protease activity HflC (stomatin/prohibitin superfamily)
MFYLAIIVLVLTLGVGIALHLFVAGIPPAVPKAIMAAGTVLAALFLLISSATSVNAGYVGVETLWGKVNSEALPAGIHFINPFAEVSFLPIRTQNYTMSAVSTEGQKAGDDSIKAISNNQLQMSIDCTVFYRLDSAFAVDVFKTNGPEVNEKVARPYIREALYNSAQNYSDMELWTNKRAAYTHDVEGVLKAGLATRHLILEKVLVRNIDPPKEVKDAIENKMKADQDAQKMVFVLAKETQEAQRKKIEAEGTAAQNNIITASLSSAILENKRLDVLRQIGEKGNLIITDSHGGATPLINVAKK